MIYEAVKLVTATRPNLGCFSLHSRPPLCIICIIFISYIIPNILYLMRLEDAVNTNVTPVQRWEANPKRYTMHHGIRTETVQSCQEAQTEQHTC